MTSHEAQRKIDAIDKRIDAVLAELYRVSGFSHDAFEYGTEEGYLAACLASTNIRRDYPGFDGFERSLFLRRHDARCTRDELIAEAARVEERRAAREYRKQYQASRHECPECGHVRIAA